MVKKNEEEKNFAKEFLAYFCSAVGMNEENILPPAGALDVKDSREFRSNK